MSQQFDAVSLDVGGVLVVPDHGVLACVLDRLGADHDRGAFAPAHYRAMAAMDAAASDPEDFTDYLDGFLEAVSVPVADRPAAHAGLTEVLRTPVWCQPVPGSRSGIAALGSAGIRLAVTSNSDGTVEDHLRRHEWCQLGPGAGARVEVVTDSGVVGVGKPDPRVFQATIDALRVPPERILHVGDSVHYDVDGGAAVGMQTVHMDPFGLCPSTAHDHVRTLADLLS
jgi:FMN phosphatase YigB (HAD superfamily)